jgi:hypothetical protein
MDERVWRVAPAWSGVTLAGTKMKNGKELVLSAQREDLRVHLVQIQAS